MASGIRIARSIGTIGVGLIVVFTLYEPIYLFIGYLLEELRGATRFNLQLASLAADIFSPICGGYITVRLAPQPKRKAILWLPGVLLAMAVLGSIFGKGNISQESQGEWVFGIILGLLGSFYGGSRAARSSE